MRDVSRYTKAAEGRVVDIASIDPDDRYARGSYRCISCSNLMVPALGRVRKHHFKHKAGRPHHCVDETYLHQLGKLTLFEALSDAIKCKKQFPLIRSQPLVCDFQEAEFGIICSNQTGDFVDDLAKKFDSVELEKGVDGYIADILLASAKTGEKLLLEISVSHRCEPEKISSGHSIVEVEIYSEDDIEPLKCGIDTVSANVTCHNLQTLEAVPKRCLDPCNVPCSLFLLYDSGKAWYAHTGSANVSELTSDPYLVAWEILGARNLQSTKDQQEFLDLFKEMIVKQKFQNHRNVRSCMLCQHNGGQRSAHDIHCNDKGRKVWMASSASSCQSYFPAEDPKEAMQLLNCNLKCLP